MPAARKNNPAIPEASRILDDFIGQYYRGLLDRLNEDPTNYKLGEFLKMIELRRKLNPDDAAQKQFWSMLERIRQERLGQTTSAEGRCPGRKSKPDRGVRKGKKDRAA
jgi:hypothetical protein